jgi:hypothetical protein
MARERDNEWYRTICLLFLYLPADFLKLFLKGPGPGPLNYKNIFGHLNNFSCILVLLTYSCVLKRLKFDAGSTHMAGSLKVFLEGSGVLNR